ncbi:hypothetical protein AZE42_11444, partial [Rhizopogon vesiculosus]
LQRANPFQRAPPLDQPAPAAGGATRNQHQHCDPPRQALAAAPRPPVVTICPVNPSQQVAATLAILAALRPAPLVNIRPRIRQPEVPAARDPPLPSLLTTRGAKEYPRPPLPPPPPAPSSPSRPAIHHTEAPTPVPPTVPQPSRLTTRRADAPGQTSSSALARVIEQHPTSTANTDTAGEVRERVTRETMGRLRTDHDCQDTAWEYQRGRGRCESGSS